VALFENHLFNLKIKYWEESDDYFKRMGHIRRNGGNGHHHRNGDDGNLRERGEENFFTSPLSPFERLISN
jgi:hypothetical protein